MSLGPLNPVRWATMISALITSTKIRDALHRKPDSWHKHSKQLLLKVEVSARNKVIPAHKMLWEHNKAIHVTKRFVPLISS